MDPITGITTALLQLLLALSSVGAAGVTVLSQLSEPAALAVLGVVMFVGAHTARRQPAAHVHDARRATQRPLRRPAALSPSRT